MKKFIKKSSTILIISLLAILMLVGCGSQNSETGVSENESTPTSAVAEEESEESVEPTSTPEASEEPTSEATPNPTEAPEATEEPTEAPETPAPTEEPTKPEPTEPPHTHNYSATSVTPPTCTTQGYTTYTCNCGDSYRDDYTTGSHNYSNGTCTTCGSSDPNYHVHSWTEHTWTEDKVTETEVNVYVCNGCGSEFADKSSLNAHQDSTGWDGTPAHTGWHNKYNWVETITQIIHHYRECACGLREDID